MWTQKQSLLYREPALPMSWYVKVDTGHWTEHMETCFFSPDGALLRSPFDISCYLGGRLWVKDKSYAGGNRGAGRQPCVEFNLKAETLMQPVKRMQETHGVKRVQHLALAVLRLISSELRIKSSLF